MNPSPRLIELLREILGGELDRGRLAKWLAQNSLEFFDSPDEADRRIISDIDAALGEIQRGGQPEEFLIEVASQLVIALRLILPSQEIVVSFSDLSIFTGTANTGGTPMAPVELVPDRSHA